MRTPTLSLATVAVGASSVLAGVTPLQPRGSSLPAITVKGNGVSIYIQYSPSSHTNALYSFLQWQ
jgi:hypothetical protein